MRRYYEDSDSACDFGHNFVAVWETGIVSHYRCTACGCTASEESVEMMRDEDEEQEEEEVEDDIVDDDDMC